MAQTTFVSPPLDTFDLYQQGMESLRLVAEGFRWTTGCYAPPARFVSAVLDPVTNVLTVVIEGADAFPPEELAQFIFVAGP